MVCVGGGVHMCVCVHVSARGEGGGGRGRGRGTPSTDRLQPLTACGRAGVGSHAICKNRQASYTPSQQAVSDSRTYNSATCLEIISCTSMLLPTRRQGCRVPAATPQSFQQREELRHNAAQPTATAPKRPASRQANYVRKLPNKLTVSLQMTGAAALLPQTLPHPH